MVLGLRLLLGCEGGGVLKNHRRFFRAFIYSILLRGDTSETQTQCDSSEPFMSRAPVDHKSLKTPTEDDCVIPGFVCEHKRRERFMRE